MAPPNGVNSASVKYRWKVSRMSSECTASVGSTTSITGSGG